MKKLAKFDPKLCCTKCGADKIGHRFEPDEPIAQAQRRRERIGWPQGDLMISTCQLCSNVWISRPLDWVEPAPSATSVPEG